MAVPFLRRSGASLAIFAIGALCGGVAVGASGTVEPLRPVGVVLHRFDMVPGQEAKRDEWIAYLKAHHREAVATLERERMYVEAMFVQPDEPGRLYWLTVQGAGAKSVETSDAELDRRHMQYMDAVLVKGSHRAATALNVLIPDFMVAAIRHHQGGER